MYHMSLSKEIKGIVVLMLVIPEYIREEVVTVLAVNFNSFFNQLALEVWIQLYTFTVLYSIFSMTIN